MLAIIEAVQAAKTLVLRSPVGDDDRYRLELGGHMDGSLSISVTKAERRATIGDPGATTVGDMIAAIITSAPFDISVHTGSYEFRRTESKVAVSYVSYEIDWARTWFVPLSELLIALTAVGRRLAA